MLHIDAHVARGAQHRAVGPRELGAERHRERGPDRAPVVDAHEGARLVAPEVAAHVLAAVAGVDDQDALARQHLADHVRDELRLDRHRVGAQRRREFRVPLGARLGEVRPRLARPGSFPRAR